MIKNNLMTYRTKFFEVIQKRYYLLLLFSIIITSLLLYWNYIFGDQTFVFRAFMDNAADTHHGYLPIYNFFASSIKNNELSSYTFQSGFGCSILDLMSTVNSPFAMLGVLVGIIFGEQYIADSMIYILILKNICSGLLCCYFLRNFKFSIGSSIIVSYIYAFNGYTMTLGEHYFFSDRPIYFLLMLIMIEKVIKGEHKIRYWIGLIVVTSLVCCILTMAYEILLSSAFYVLFRVIYIYEKDFKKIIKRLGICLAFVLLGMCISSFVLIPQMGKAVGSGRLSQSVNVFNFNDISVIATGIFRLFSNNLEGTFNSYYGTGGFYTNYFPYYFTVMLVPMASQYIWRSFKDKFSVKEKIFRMLLIFTVFFSIIDQFIFLALSFFVPHYHQFIYVFLPIFAYIFADTIDGLKKGKYSRIINYITMIVSAGVIVYGGLSTYNKGSDNSIMWMLFPLAMLILGCVVCDNLFFVSSQSVQISSGNRLKKASTALLAVVLALNLFGENFITLYYSRHTLSKEDAHAPMLMSSVSELINKKEKDNFFRFETSYADGMMCGYTYPLLFPIRATAYYDSANNSGIPEFYRKCFNPLGKEYSEMASNYLSASGMLYNSIIDDILGIKYLLLNDDIVKNGWEKNNDYSDRGAILYKNSGLNSAGLFFDSYIGQDEADLMSFNNRIFGLGTRLVLDNPVSNIDDFAAKYSEDSDTIHNIIEISNNNEPIKNRGIDIESLLPYQGVISDVSENMDGYNVKAVFEAEDSNFSFLIDKDVIGERNKITQISFKLKENGENLSFVYFDEDEVWKYVSKVEKKTYGNESVYTFIIPQTASHLALCVDRSCELDVNFSTETYDISNEILDINAIEPFNGTITSSVFKNNEYTIGAIMDNDDSNFSFSLNREIISDKNKITQISFKLKDGSMLNTFAYYDADGTWKNIPIEVNREIDDYTFVIPQTASHLALCVNQPCELKAAFSVKTYDVTNEAADARSAACYNGTVQKSVIEDNEFRFAAKMDSSDSNFQIYLNTDIVNDRNKSTQISYRLKDSSVVKNFVYYDADNTWKSMPKIEPETDGEESVYKFIIPQTASSLALCVNQPCELDIKVSSETVASTYTNNGIYLDNPKRGNIITGTVEAEKNSLLYLPVPYNEYWDAYIDGEKVEIMKANYAFMAIPVTAGEHHVDLIYSNKIYHTFLKVSITAVILVTAFFITYAVIRRQKQNKEKRENLHDIF